jgi:iron complex transport system substrate-binding protein
MSGAVRAGPTRRQCIAGLAGLTVCGGRAFAAASIAPRIAAPDWAAAESLLAVGVPPLAVADVDVYREWLPEISLPAGVVDLGSRAEPNLELLAALRPDRILISNWQRSLIDRFERIAPTQVLSIVAPPASPLDNAGAALAAVAAPLGKAEDARRYRTAFAATLAAGAAGLSDRKGMPVIVGVLHENGRQLYAYGPGSWVHEILLRLGLRNGLAVPTSRFGNALIAVAQLAATPEATLLYLDQGSRTRRAESALRDNTLWRGLPLVRAGRVRAIPAFYALGGLPSAWRCARLIRDAVAEAPRSADG